MIDDDLPWASPDEPETLGRVFRKERWYPVDPAYFGDTVHTYTQRPIVHVHLDDGSEAERHLIAVLLPENASFVSVPPWEQSDGRESWKCYDYRVQVGEMGASEGFRRLTQHHVSRIVFPNGVIPSFDEITRGERLDPTKNSPLDPQKTWLTPLTDGCRAFLRKLLRLG